MSNWIDTYVQISGPEEDRCRLAKLMRSEESIFDFNRVIPMPESLKVTRHMKEECIALACWADYRGETARLLEEQRRYASGDQARFRQAQQNLVENQNPLFRIRIIAAGRQIEQIETLPQFVRYLEETIAKEHSLLLEAETARQPNPADVQVIYDELCRISPLEFGRFLLKNKRMHGAVDYYDWRIFNWGTKGTGWDITTATDGDILSYNLTTAWTCPHPVFDELANRFPRLHFRLSIGGQCEPYSMCLNW